VKDNPARRNWSVPAHGAVLLRLFPG